MPCFVKKLNQTRNILEEKILSYHFKCVCLAIFYKRRGVKLFLILFCTNHDHAPVWVVIHRYLHLVLPCEVFFDTLNQ